MIRLDLQLFASTISKNKVNKLKNKATKATNNYTKFIEQGFDTSDEIDSYKTLRDEYTGKYASGQTQYTSQMNQYLDEYLNRDKFTYDADSDAMFQQYLSSAMKSGKTAMQDTMGQAAALTGGYGNSYASSAAAQAYNAYVQDAYNALPEYYQMALDRYNMEGEDLYNKYAMLFDADQAELERYYNSANMYGSYYDAGYANEFNEWSAKGDGLYNIAALAQNRADSGVSEYWTGKEFTQGVKEFNATLAAASTGSSDSSGKGNEVKEWSLTDDQYTKIQNLYISHGGGDAGKEAVINYLDVMNNLPDEAHYETLNSILDALDGQVAKSELFFSKYGTGTGK